MSWLARGTLVLLALAVAHDLDHFFNQPDRDYAMEITVAAILSYPLLLGTLFLARRRHPFAPHAAIYTGFAFAAGFALVHIAPHWSAFSDPYSEISADALSWLLVAIPIAAGLTLGVLGLRELIAGRRAAVTH